MSQSMLARLNRLQSTAAAPKPDRVIKFTQEPEDEASPEVLRRWNEYRRTGQADGDTVIVPTGYEVFPFPNGQLVIVEEVEDFYNNNAFERERKARQSAAGDSGQ